jgi:hypothetical protein
MGEEPGRVDLDGAAKAAPGVGVLLGAVKAGCPARPSRFAPVQPRRALLAEHLHYPLRSHRTTALK